MDCEKCRESLSARLDGEDRISQGGAVDAHLQWCAACRDWFDTAARVTRLARIGLTLPSPGVPTSVLDAAPGPRRTRLAIAMRLALGLIGAAQILYAIAQIAGSTMGTMSIAAMSASVQGATPDHLLHESAAWNIGVGVAFLLISGKFARPASVVAILTAFVAALTLLTVSDLTTGEVSWGRVASHLLLLIGYLIVVTLSRPSISMHEPPSGREHDRRWRLTSTTTESARMTMPSSSPSGARTVLVRGEVAAQKKQAA
jgi:predicted anti-sigma-YlaC factor YlaD